MKLIVVSVVTVLTFLSTQFTVAQAKVLQEGWFQVLSGQQHVGYIVHRYEFNEAKKQFKFNSFMKTNSLGGDIAESVSATSSDAFAPISYQYTTQSGKSVKLIDASFKNNQMTAKITEDGQARTELAKLEKGSILSYFLVYKILMGKHGIKDALSVEYSAIAEEDAKIFKGFLDIKTSEAVSGHDTFKILNTFKDIKSISVITPTGEILQIRQPTTGLQVVATTKEEATKGFPSSEKTIKTLFGNIPGNSPILAHATSSSAPKETPQKTIDPIVNETGLPKGTTIPPGKPFNTPNKEKND